MKITITIVPHRTLIEIPDSELLLKIGVRSMGIPLDCSKYRKWVGTITHVMQKKYEMTLVPLSLGAVRRGSLCTPVPGLTLLLCQERIEYSIFG